MLDLKQVVSEAKANGLSYNQTIASVISRELGELLTPIGSLSSFTIERSAKAKVVVVKFAAVKADGRHAMIKVAWGDATLSGNLVLDVSLDLTAENSTGTGRMFIKDVDDARGAIEGIFDTHKAEFRRFISYTVNQVPW